MKKIGIAFLTAGTMCLTSCATAVEPSTNFVSESGSKSTSLSSISSSHLENQSENSGSATPDDQAQQLDDTYYYKVDYPEFEGIPQFEEKAATQVSAEIQSYLFLNEIVWYPTFGNGKAYFCSEDSKNDNLTWNVNVLDLNTGQNQRFPTECITYDINEYEGSYYWVEKYTDNLGDWKIYTQNGIDGEGEIIYTPDNQSPARAPRIQIYNNMILWNQSVLSEDGEDKFALQLLDIGTKEVQTVILTDDRFFQAKSLVSDGVIAYGAFGEKGYKLQAFDLNSLQIVAEVELDTEREKSDKGSNSLYNLQALEDAGYDISEFELDEGNDWPYNVMYKNGYFYFELWDSSFPYMIDTHKQEIYPLASSVYNVMFVGMDKIAWTTSDTFCILDLPEKKLDICEPLRHGGKTIRTLHNFYVRDNGLISRGYIDTEDEGKVLEGIVYFKLDGLEP